MGQPGVVPEGVSRTGEPRGGPWPPHRSPSRSSQRTWDYITETQVWKSIFRHGMPRRPPQPRAGDADQRLPAPAPGRSPQERHPPEVHLVHGRADVLPVPGRDRHRRAADVLLPADGRVRLQRHPRPARARAARHHARDAPLGRPRDGHHGLAAHVPRVPDRLLQAAARVQLGRRRHPAGADAAALASPATCCRGTSSPSGPSPSAPTWRARRRSWAAKGPARSCSPSATCRWSTPAATRASCCSAGASSARARCCASTCCTASSSRWSAGVLMAVHFWRVRKDGGISGPL